MRRGLWFCSKGEGNECGVMVLLIKIKTGLRFCFEDKATFMPIKISSSSLILFASFFVLKPFEASGVCTLNPAARQRLSRITHCLSRMPSHIVYHASHIICHACHHTLFITHHTFHSFWKNTAAWSASMSARAPTAAPFVLLRSSCIAQSENLGRGWVVALSDLTTHVLLHFLLQQPHLLADFRHEHRPLPPLPSPLALLQDPDSFVQGSLLLTMRREHIVVLLAVASNILLHFLLEQTTYIVTLFAVINHIYCYTFCCNQPSPPFRAPPPRPRGSGSERTPTPCEEVRVWGLGFGVWGLGFHVLWVAPGCAAAPRLHRRSSGGR